MEALDHRHRGLLDLAAGLDEADDVGPSGSLRRPWAISMSVFSTPPRRASAMSLSPVSRE
jgi:hypothetical protein